MKETYKLLVIAALTAVVVFVIGRTYHTYRTPERLSVPSFVQCTTPIFVKNVKGYRQVYEVPCEEPSSTSYQNDIAIGNSVCIGAKACKDAFYVDAPANFLVAIPSPETLLTVICRGKDCTYIRYNNLACTDMTAISREQFIRATTIK